MFESISYFLSLATNLLTIGVSIIILIVAVVSLLVALKALKNSQEQFEDNKEQSQAMFDANIKKADILSNKIIDQIITLQSITDNQIKITEKQLKTSKEILKDQLSFGRPYVLLDIYRSITVGHKRRKDSSWYTPLINFSLKNQGSRPAAGCAIFYFLVYSDYSKVCRDKFPIFTTNIPPGTQAEIKFEPQIDKGYEKDFYVVIKFRYSDMKIPKNYTEFKMFQFSNKTKRLHEVPIRNDKVIEAIDKELKANNIYPIGDL